MSSLFRKPQAPAPVYMYAPAPAPVPTSPVPVAPTAPTSTAPAAPTAAQTQTAQVERDKTSAAVVADAQAGGRSNDIVAGMQIARTGQSQRGLLSMKKRAAATELGD